MFTPIRLPDDAQAIVIALFQRYIDLAKGDDDQRRALTGKIAEQIRFTLGSAWGWKKAGGPPSKDTIAKRDGEVLHGFDLFNGATREPNDHPMSVDISAQTFIEVSPVNHLGSTVPPPVIQPPASSADLSAVLGKLDALAADVREMRFLLKAVSQDTDVIYDKVTTPQAAATVQFPKYKGKNRYLGEITLEPQP